MQTRDVTDVEGGDCEEVYRNVYMKRKKRRTSRRDGGGGWLSVVCECECECEYMGVCMYV